MFGDEPWPGLAKGVRSRRSRAQRRRGTFEPAAVRTPRVAGFGWLRPSASPAMGGMPHRLHKRGGRPIALTQVKFVFAFPSLSGVTCPSQPAWLRPIREE